jgi:hypothetical protein
MRVDRLYIICIRRQDPRDFTYQDPQFSDEAKALAMRSVILEKTGTAEIVEYAPCTYEGSGANTRVVDGPKRIGATETVYGTARSTSTPRIGIYIIAHGSQEGMSGLKFSDLATILNNHGIKKIDKLSLVSCTIGKDYAGEDLPPSWNLEGVSKDQFRSYLARMCGFLGSNDYGNGTDGKIMVAGWTTYVTVAFPGRKETSMLGKKTTKSEKWAPFDQRDRTALLKMNSGRKFAADLADKEKKKPVHEIRASNPAGVGKVFFAWTRSEGLHPIQETEWTDKLLGAKVEVEVKGKGKEKVKV